MYGSSSYENYFSIRIENYVWLIQVSTAWGIGLIIGPALGGLLAQVLQCFDLVCWQIHVAASFSFSSFGSIVLMFLLILQSACREISKYIFERISVWKVSEVLLLNYSFEIFWKVLWGWWSSGKCLCRFPYFLPCLFISLFAFGVTIATFWLPVR